MAADRSAPSRVPGMGIGVVEQQTGISKELLRVWERRYSFPRPVRSPDGERLYSPEDVARLRLVRRLIDLGHRPRSIVGKKAAELEALLPSPRRSGATSEGRRRQEALSLIKGRKITELRAWLMGVMLREGVSKFLIETLGPLLEEVGDSWSCGELTIYHEHLFTEQVQQVLRRAIEALPASDRGPRILLTTLPGEAHALGLLMAEALFTAEEAACLSLGPQTPVDEVVACAAAEPIDVVALSSSAGCAARVARRAIDELRAGIDRDIEIWSGGAGASLIGERSGVRLLPTLDAGIAAVDAWRSRNPAR